MDTADLADSRESKKTAPRIDPSKVALLKEPTENDFVKQSSSSVDIANARSI